MSYFELVPAVILCLCCDKDGEKKILKKPVWLEAATLNNQLQFEEKAT
jgi:hypothetical protein